MFTLFLKSEIQTWVGCLISLKEIGNTLTLTVLKMNVVNFEEHQFLLMKDIFP